ncbi:hypothetical protein QBC43DRAFT_220076 [Cladorrhinum sp. PSN259]|nr:hypothetical protein QBC43DRAFT_220076 [Cladorrhinum sp. PSN259]
MAPSHNPHISLSVFRNTIWAFAALATVFLAVRIYARLVAARRLFYDDALVIFAALLVVTMAAIWQCNAPDMYYVLKVSAGAPPDDIGDLLRKLKRTMNITGVAQVLFCSTLTAVKLSVVLFFRRIDMNVDKLRHVWWPLVGFILALWAVSIGTNPWQCFVGNPEYILANCQKPDHVRYVRVTMKFNSAMDVCSDFLIMIIPVIMVWNTRLRLAKKMAFIGLFSLTIITMVAAIVRAVDNLAFRWNSGAQDVTYVFLWSSIEASLAVMVASFSAFPQLFAASAKKASKTYKPTETFLERMRRARTRNANAQDNHINDLDTMVSQVDNFNYVAVPGSTKTASNTLISQPGDLENRLGSQANHGDLCRDIQQPGIVYTRDYEVRND